MRRLVCREGVDQFVVKVVCEGLIVNVVLNGLALSSERRSGCAELAPLA